MSKVKIGLALGGGGALGMAHVGVLKALEENGIKPQIIVGTSIGSLVGGVYASGLPLDVIEEEALKVKTSQLVDVSLNLMGILSGKSAMKLIKNIIKSDYLIEDLKIKFGAVAVNLADGEEVLFTSGSLLDSIRASISVPGVFVPFKIGNKYYVDGGVLNNVPENHVKNMGADFIVSVDLLSDYKPNAVPKTAISAITYSSFVMQKRVTELMPKFADVRINLKLNEFKQEVFNRKEAEKLIEIGYNETLKLIPKIKKLLDKKQKKLNGKKLEKTPKQ